MNVTREEKKAEAVRRMKLWGIYGPTREQFRKSNLVSISEPPLGACFWVNDEEKADIEAFEKEYNALVYHVVRSFTEFGTLDTYLYVSDHPEEWEMDLEDLKDGYQCCYVKNHDDPWCSEFGSVLLRLTPAAGLKRIG